MQPTKNTKQVQPNTPKDLNPGARPISNGLSLSGTRCLAGYKKLIQYIYGENQTVFSILMDALPGKAGRPKEALTIYVHVLDDLEAARAYCKVLH